MTTEAQSIAALIAESHFEPREIEVNGRVFLAHDPRAAIKEVTPLNGDAPQPAHVHAKPTLHSKQSFSDYVARYAIDDETVIFADLSAYAFEAIIDYHGVSSGPNHCFHKAAFALRVTEEWSRWSSRSGKLGSQADFARFLEENHTEVVRPTGADLLEIVKDFQAVRSVNFSQSIRLDNGDAEFAYTTETNGTTAKGTLIVPTMFELLLPIFYGEPATEVRAFLRYFLDDGALKIGYELHRAEFVKQAVFETVARDVAEATAQPVLSGKAG